MSAARVTEDSHRAAAELAAIVDRRRAKPSPVEVTMKVDVKNKGGKAKAGAKVSVKIN